MSATLASVLLVFLVVSLTQPHLLDSRAAKPRLTHLLDSRAVKPRHTHLLDSRATKPRLTLYSLDSRAATVRRPSTSLTTLYHCWTSTRPLLEVTTVLYFKSSLVVLQPQHQSAFMAWMVRVAFATLLCHYRMLYSTKSKSRAS